MLLNLREDLGVIPLVIAIIISVVTSMLYTYIRYINVYDFEKGKNIRRMYVDDLVAFV
jgi:hypothetical protein